MNGPDNPTSVGLRLGRSYDTKTDGGYGRSSDRFHKQRAKGGNFPYAEPVNYDELPVEDEDLVKNILNKMRGSADPSDSLSGRAADRFAFQGGNRRVGPDSGLNIEAAGTGMVPFPAMYKKRIQGGGGVNKPVAYDPGQSPRTGTYRGWSQAPVTPGDTAKFSEIEDGEDPTIVKLRKVIGDIIRQQEEIERCR
jgi:hypothetical protein